MRSSFGTKSLGNTQRWRTAHGLYLSTATSVYFFIEKNVRKIKRIFVGKNITEFTCAPSKFALECIEVCV